MSAVLTRFARPRCVFFYLLCIHHGYLSLVIAGIKEGSLAETDRYLSKAAKDRRPESMISLSYCESTYPINISSTSSTSFTRS